MGQFVFEFENESQKVPLCAETVEKLVRRIIEDAGYQNGMMEITVIDDKTIHELNVEYLGHDYPTDVLAFELDRDEANRLLEGNVIVSDETALDRSSDYGWSAENELLLYIVHGTLHLVGYDDHAPEDEQLMRAKEREYLALAGIEKIAGSSDLGKKGD